VANLFFSFLFSQNLVYFCQLDGVRCRFIVAGMEKLDLKEDERA
jgi:hypothetical protein